MNNKSSHSTPPSQSPGVVVGVDVGGTFTDLFVLDLGANQAHIIKVPSTRGQEAQGFMRGIEAVHHVLQPESAVGEGSEAAHPGLASCITTLVHGTTVATNALLERNASHLGPKGRCQPSRPFLILKYIECPIPSPHNAFRS